MFIFYLVCFFFFKQKTAYEMRISDWSSDVCSSDLLVFALIAQDHFVDLLQIVLADFIATLLPLLPGWVDKDDSRDDRRNPDSGHESDHDNAHIHICSLAGASSPRISARYLQKMSALMPAMAKALRNTREVNSPFKKM